MIRQELLIAFAGLVAIPSVCERRMPTPCEG